MPRGGWREAARGKTGPKPMYRPRLPHEVGITMQMIAWQRAGRPTTDDETTETLADLIREEAARITAASEAAKEG